MIKLSPKGGKQNGLKRWHFKKIGQKRWKKVKFVLENLLHKNEIFYVDPKYNSKLTFLKINKR